MKMNTNNPHLFLGDQHHFAFLSLFVRHANNYDDDYCLFTPNLVLSCSHIDISFDDNAQGQLSSSVAIGVTSDRDNFLHMQL